MNHPDRESDESYSKLKTSVVIVTYNRNKDCKEAVLSVLRQRKPPFEVIVVDDASLIPFQFEAPSVKIIRNETERGLAASRNIGVHLSTGDIIAFIDDDDALATPNWNQKLQEAFTADIDIVGGPCKPLYLSSLPKWWDEKLFGILCGISYHGVVGCNFAVKKETFNKVGYFNERLGRIHGKLISNEETEFFERVKRAYGRIVFEKDLEVYHKVYPNRLTMSYLLRRVWYQGITECIQYPVSTHLRKTLGCFRLIVVYLIKMLINRKNMRYYLIKMVAQLGFIFGLFISRSFNNEDALLGKTKHH